MHSIIVCRKLSEEKYVPPCYCTAYTDLETDRYMRKLRNSAKHLHQQGMSVQQFQTGAVLMHLIMCVFFSFLMLFREQA